MNVTTKSKGANRLLLAYYDATLVFIALDFLFGIDVRIAFLEDKPAWRAAYYMFCLACAALMHLRPDLRVAVGALEGMVTMIGLIFGAYTGYIFMGLSGVGELLQVLLNYAISGYFAQLAWARGMRDLSRRSKFS